MSVVPMVPRVFFLPLSSSLAYPGLSEQCELDDQRYNWCSGQDTQQVGEPEAPLDGGSQWPLYSRWYHVAAILSAGTLVEDWEVVDGLLASTEKALQAVSSLLLHRLPGTVGWIFLTALKANMDSALSDAVLGCSAQRGLKGPEHRTLALKQELRGPEEPSISDGEAVTLMMKVNETVGSHLAVRPIHCAAENGA